MRFLKILREVQFKRLLTKRNIGLLIIVTILLSWGFFRGCEKERVPRKRFYTIGRDSTWYPFHLRGKERNLVAFTNELMDAISEETKLYWDWFETNPSNLVDGLNAENYDAIISSLRPDIINQNQYLFSELFFELGLVLVVRENSSVTSLKDLQGKTLGISKTSYPIFNAIREGGAYQYNIQVITYNNVNQGLDMLQNNLLDGIITHTVSAYTLIRSYNRADLKIATAPFTDEGLRLMTLKNEDSEALIKDFDQALKKLKENGVYAELIDKWNLIDPTAQFDKNSSP